MKKFFSIFTVVALVLGFTACENTEPQPDNKEYTVELSADKTTILADGEESVTFTAQVDGAADEDVQIICLNDNSILEGNTFTTTVAGEYNFKAVYKKFSSDTVTINATAVEIPVAQVELIADKTEIKADNTDTVTFTVTVDGEDKTSEAKITIINYNAELEGNTFVTDVAGEFVFVTKFDGVKSNEIKVTATAVEAPVEKKLTISTDKVRIKADGEDKATLTVLYGENDVTSESEIYVEQTKEVLTDATFSTTEAASYTIRAKYDGKTSTFVTIDAYDPVLAEQYEVGTIIDINGTKGIIFAIKGFPVYNEDYTEVIGTNQYCYVFSMDEEDLQWSTEYVWCNCGTQRGDWNTEDMLRFGTSPDKYPAAQWCQAHGEGWFLPSYNELNWMWEMLTDGARDFTAPSVAKYNELIVENGGEPFCETYYWSSNETSEDLVELVAFMNDSVVCLDPKKDNTYTARAAYRFKVE